MTCSCFLDFFSSLSFLNSPLISFTTIMTPAFTMVNNTLRPLLHHEHQGSPTQADDDLSLVEVSFNKTLSNNNYTNTPTNY